VLFFLAETSYTSYIYNMINKKISNIYIYIYIYIPSSDFFGGGRDLNLKPCICYALSLPTE